MKILLIHADYIEFEAKKKAMKDAEEIDAEKKKVNECLVVFTASEKQDEKNPTEVTARYLQEIKDVAEKVGAKTIVLYPYAHLSSDLASPKVALEIMKTAESLLKDDFEEVVRAPFGWYKSFTISNKGHPLSELSREIQVDKKEDLTSEALKKEETELVSDWHVLDTEGNLHNIKLEDNKIKGFDFTNHKNLLKFFKYEMAKSRAVDQEPPHVKYMKKLELVDYEPGSDPGNLRYYPKGAMIKRLLEEHVSKRIREYGGMEIEAPIMYDYSHPALSKYLNRFPARQYTIDTPNKKVFLRFAACFGSFLQAKDATISYKNLPFRIFELTRYSFRVEKHGELTGLRRLRAFTMPDCHAMCKDIEMAKEEMMTRFKFAKGLNEEIGFKVPGDFEFALRVTKDFYDANKEYITSLVKEWGKPAMIEIWNQKFFYFILKLELNFVDALNKAACLYTDQIDVENGERFGIEFTDKDGKNKHPIILHMAATGAIERDLYAFLERAAIDEKQGKPAMLPLWLSPTQVRVIPVSNENHTEYAIKLAKEISESNIRCDVDDTDQTLGKKIRSAEKEWIPYIIVIGDEEIESNQLSIRIRETKAQEKMTKEDLTKQIKEVTKDKIYKKLPVPMLLSKRPIFFSS